MTDIAKHSEKAAQDSDRRKSNKRLKEIVETARAIANGEEHDPIGPEDAKDISLICGTAVVDCDGRRFLFGHERPPEERDKLGGEISLADDWYRFRHLVEPMYWMTQRISPEHAVGAIPLHARRDAWDALSAVTNWMTRGVSSWAEQFRDPNRINADNCQSPEDDAFGMVLSSREKQISQDAHRAACDAAMFEQLHESVDRLREHVERNEHVTPDVDVASEIESAIDQLVTAAPERRQARVSLESAGIGLRELQAIASSSEIDEEEREAIRRGLADVRKLVSSVSALVKK